MHYDYNRAEFVCDECDGRVSRSAYEVGVRHTCNTVTPPVSNAPAGFSIGGSIELRIKIEVVDGVVKATLI